MFQSYLMDIPVIPCAGNEICLDRAVYAGANCRVEAQEWVSTGYQ
jgi:hypothetical protein